MTASTRIITGLTSDTSLENLHLGAVTHVAVLSTAIDRTIDRWTGTVDRTIFRCAADIDGRLIDIS